MALISPERLRIHADVLRSIAAGRRAEALTGPAHWRERNTREADRLEAEADDATREAVQIETDEMEDEYGDAA